LLRWHKILLRICSKQELWSQKNSRCLQTALKQHLFLSSGCGKNNGTSIARQQILDKQQINSNRGMVFCV
jgi:hypothetical protein